MALGEEKNLINRTVQLIKLGSDTNSQIKTVKSVESQLVSRNYSKN